MNGVLVVDKPSGPDLARRRGASCGGRWRPAHRPHRHARSARDRRAAARRRPRHAAGAVPRERRREGIRRRRSGFGVATRDLRRGGARRQRPTSEAETAAAVAALDEAPCASALADVPRARSCRRRRRSRRRRSAGSRPTSWRDSSKPVELKPVEVTVRELELVAATPTASPTLRLVLLERLLRPLAGARPRASGSGAARTSRRCGGRGPASSRLDDAVPLETRRRRRRTGRRGAAGRHGPRCCRACRRSSLTERRARERARHGNDARRRRDLAASRSGGPPASGDRVCGSWTQSGALRRIAERRADGLLHPVVVLG